MKNVMKAIAALMLMVIMVAIPGCNDKPSKSGGENSDGGNSAGGNNNTDVLVTTYTPRVISLSSVKSGGDVIVPQGLKLNELGVCWSESRNPTVEDSHLSTSNWSEPYVCTITGLKPGTKYHVRAYVLRGLEYYYGEDKSFTTEKNGSGGGNSSFNGHEYVDLGLPSGTLWATCNVFATTPEGYGEYFAWGETKPKNIYNWITYKYCNGDYEQLTKYCYDADFGYNGFFDNLTLLHSSDDAATANWGNGWCIPTTEQWKELYQNTTGTMITRNGVEGWLFTSNNKNTLFLPAAGRFFDSELQDVGSFGGYWSSSSCTYWRPDLAVGFCFSQNSFMYEGSFLYRSLGISVRAVRSAN